MAKYEIGGVHVEMSAAAAERWNAADTTAHDLRTVRVLVPTPANHYREISLARATSGRLEPTVAAMLYGMPATLIG